MYYLIEDILNRYHRSLKICNKINELHFLQNFLNESLLFTQLRVAIDFHGMEKNTIESIATVNCLVTHILQNIFFNIKSKLIQVNDMRVSINNIIFYFGWTNPLQKQAVFLSISSTPEVRQPFSILSNDMNGLTEKSLNKICIPIIWTKYCCCCSTNYNTFCDEVGWSHQNLSHNRSEFISSSAKLKVPSNPGSSQARCTTLIQTFHTKS